MVRVSLDRSLAAEWFGGQGTVEAEARNVLQLVAALDRMAPGFAEVAPVRTVFAVDGEVAADWSVAISDASEVILLPRIGGGQDIPLPLAGGGVQRHVTLNTGGPDRGGWITGTSPTAGAARRLRPPASGRGEC